jgi:hypothetical protein
MDSFDKTEEYFFKDAISTRGAFQNFMYKINHILEPNVSSIIKSATTTETACWNGGGRSWKKFFDCSSVSDIEKLSMLEEISIIAGNYDIFLLSSNDDEFVETVKYIKTELQLLVDLLNSPECPVSETHSFAVVFPKKISDRASRNKILFPPEQCALFNCVNMAITVDKKRRKRSTVSSGKPADSDLFDFEPGKHVIYVECSYMKNLDVETFKSRLLTTVCSKTNEQLNYPIPNETGFMIFSESILINRSEEKGGINVDKYRHTILEKIIKLPYNFFYDIFFSIENNIPIDINAFWKDLNALTGNHFTYLKALLITTISAYNILDELVLNQLLSVLNSFTPRMSIEQIQSLKYFYENKNLENYNKLKDEVYRVYNEINFSKLQQVSFSALTSYSLLFGRIKVGSEPKVPAYNKVIASNIAMNLFPENITDKLNEYMMELLRPYLNFCVYSLDLSLKTQGLYPHDAYVFVAGGDSMRRYDDSLSKTADIDTKLFYRSNKNVFSKLKHCVINNLIRMITLFNSVDDRIFYGIPPRKSQVYFNYKISETDIIPITITVEIPILRSDINQYRVRFTRKTPHFPVNLFSIDYRTSISMTINSGGRWPDFNLIRSYDLAILDVPMIEHKELPPIADCIYDPTAKLPVASPKFLIKDIKRMYSTDELIRGRIQKQDKDKKRIKRLTELQVLLPHAYNYEFDIMSSGVGLLFTPEMEKQSVNIISDFNIKMADKSVTRPKTFFDPINNIVTDYDDDYD